MPAYDSERYSPAAAVATVSVRNLGSGASVDEVSMVLDSGADISALPKAVVDALTLAVGDRVYEVMAYDNTVRESPTVHAKIVFMRGHFKGQFIVLDQDDGVLGRNVLNHFIVTLIGRVSNGTYGSAEQVRRTSDSSGAGASGGRSTTSGVAPAR